MSNKTTETINLGVNFTADTTQAISSLKALQEKFSAMGNNPAIKTLDTRLETIVNQLKTANINAAKTPTKGLFNSLANQATTAGVKIESIASDVLELKNTLSRQQKFELIGGEEGEKLQKLSKAWDAYARKKAQVEKDNAAEQSKIDSNKVQISNKTTKKAELEKKIAGQNETTLRDQEAAAKTALAQWDKGQKSLAKYKKQLEEVNNLLAKLENKENQSLSEEDLAEYDTLQKKQSTLTNTIKDKTPSKEIGHEGDTDEQYREHLLKQVESSRATLKTYNDTTKAIGQYDREIVKLKEANKASEDTIERNNNSLRAGGQAYEDLAQSATDAGYDVQDLTKKGKDLGDALDKELTTEAQRADQVIDDYANSLKEAKAATDNASQSAKDNANSLQQENEAARKIDGFKQRIQQFLGLQGAALLARRVLQDVMETIKELDATMTEMAVVTDLGVGDYWEQIPDYTARANELGVVINDTYKAATLYYQQGLKTNEVIGISNETLKMAKIAGLEAEDATNKMTAALRGFNMELNQTSAQRVSDVYSELAAITASDTEEISNAMTKTASIASSANMEFETTAAFLSQIIETTRESAETAGTALTFGA